MPLYPRRGDGVPGKTSPIAAMQAQMFIHALFIKRLRNAHRSMRYAVNNQY